MTKVDFLFVYEVKAREFENICLLAAELENRGFTTAFINSWQALQRPNIKNKYECSVCVISAGYNQGTIRYFSSHTQKFKYIVNLHWEQIAMNLYMNNKEILSWDFDEFANNITHICWGEKIKNRLITKFHMKPEQLAVVGYLPLDFYSPKLNPLLTLKENLFNDCALDINKKTILFISSFPSTNLPNELKVENSDDTDKELETQQSDSKRNILQWFEMALSENPDLQIIYRPHPTEIACEQIINVRNKHKNFFIIPESSIKHWINACDIIYTFVSTSAIEMYISKKPTFVLRPIVLNEEYDFVIYKNCTSIKKYEEFAASINVDPDSFKFPLDERLLLSYYLLDDIPTYKKIADLLVEKHSLNLNIQQSIGTIDVNWEVNLRKETARIRHDIYKSTNLYDLAMDFIAKKFKIPLRNFEERRKSLNARMENLAKLYAQLATLNEILNRKNAKYYLQLAKRNGSSKREIRSTIDKFKKII